MPNMNITADLDIRYALPLCGYIMPFLVVVTIIANMLMVLVLSSSSPKEEKPQR